MDSSRPDADARIQRLEDEQGILDTLQRYAHAIDYGLEDDFVDCFTEDAVWDSRRNPVAARGAPEHRFEGRAELRGFVGAHTRPPDGWHKHVVTEAHVELDGDRGRAASYVVRVDAHPAGSYIRAFGRYRDQLVRCPDGRWRIEERIVEIDGTHPFGEPSAGPDLSQAMAIEEIKRLKARYCHLLDTHRYPEWGALLTDDAQLRIGRPEDGPMEGRDAIVAQVSRIAADLMTVHQVSTPDIRLVDGRRAEATWAAFVISRSASTSDTAEHRWGWHEDRYELGEDDQWRIASVEVSWVHSERR